VTAPRPRYRVALLVREDVWSSVRDQLASSGGVLRELAPVSPDVQRFDLTWTAVEEPAVEVVLTPREREVLGCVARGVSTYAIAAELFVAYDTVKTHLKNVFKKLGVSDRAHAVAVAYERGLLGGPS
jgi:ATP/maltotriose-dependent transcriptional regulator MalT